MNPLGLPSFLPSIRSHFLIVTWVGIGGGTHSVWFHHFLGGPDYQVKGVHACVCVCVCVRLYQLLLLFSQQVMSDSFWPHELQNIRLPCPPLSQSLLKFMAIELVMPSNHLILCHSLLLLPSIFPSIRVFTNESVRRIRWPKYWSFSFSFSISPFNEYSGLISFRMNWLHLLAVKVSFKSLPQNHSSKASVLQRSAFFTLCILLCKNILIK